MDRTEKYNTELHELNDRLQQKQISQEDFLSIRRQLIAEFGGKDAQLAPSRNTPLAWLLAAGFTLLVIGMLYLTL